MNITQWTSELVSQVKKMYREVFGENVDLTFKWSKDVIDQSGNIISPEEGRRLEWTFYLSSMQEDDVAEPIFTVVIMEFERVEKHYCFLAYAPFVDVYVPVGIEGFSQIFNPYKRSDKNFQIISQFLVSFIWLRKSVLPVICPTKRTAEAFWVNGKYGKNWIAVDCKWGEIEGLSFWDDLLHPYSFNLCMVYPDYITVEFWSKSKFKEQMRVLFKQYLIPINQAEVHRNLQEALKSAEISLI